MQRCQCVNSSALKSKRAEWFGKYSAVTESMLNTSKTSEWTSSYHVSRTALVTLRLYFAESLNLLSMLPHLRDLNQRNAEVMATNARPCFFPVDLAMSLTAEDAMKLCEDFERHKVIQNAASLTDPAAPRNISFKHYICMNIPGNSNECHFYVIDSRLSWETQAVGKPFLSAGKVCVTCQGIAVVPCCRSQQRQRRR